MQNLIELETQGWQALSTGKDAAQEFYRSLLTDEAVMLFPGGILLRGKEEILESIGLQPWNTFHFEETHTVTLAENAGAVVYKVTARRKGSATYIALISSLYILSDEGWKLALHQQTPI
ncbi:MAG: nuclear transport factor 2 family protein [Anaerolineales bacterium]